MLFLFVLIHKHVCFITEFNIYYFCYNSLTIITINLNVQKTQPTGLKIIHSSSNLLETLD